MTKYRLWIFTLLSTFLFFIYTANAQGDTQFDNTGLLYKITGNGLEKPSYLFGTIHLVCPKDLLPLNKLKSLISETDEVLLELDLDDPKELLQAAKYTTLPAGKTLSDLLTPGEYAKVDELFINLTGNSVDSFKTLKPFFLNVFLLSSPKVSGCQQPDTYDMLISRVATAMGKPVEGLETVEQQFALINSMSFSVQASALYSIALNPEKLISEFNKLVETYKLQDSEKLFELIEYQFGAQRELQVDFFETRNKRWIPKIEEAIKTKSLVIAVGGGHLGGQTGVVNLLRARGYKLTAIKL